MRRKLTLTAALLPIALFATPSEAALEPALFRQLPDQFGGPGSDSAFVSDSGEEIWQIVADDFQFSNPTTVCGVNWWGFYGSGGFPQTPEQLSPPAHETMRVQFYSNADGVPDSVIWEATYQDLAQTPTGLSILLFPIRNEYQWKAVLPTCFQAQPFVTYWISITQLNDVDSHFRWESTYSAPGLVFQNTHTGHEWITGSNVGASFELFGVPEPTGAALMVLGVFAIRHRRANRTSLIHLSTSGQCDPS